MFQPWPFKPKIKGKDKNGPVKSLRKFYIVSIMRQKTHQKHAQLKEPTNLGVEETKQRENTQILISQPMSEDMYYIKKGLTEVEINKIEEVFKAIVQKVKSNIDKREEYGEKDNLDWISR